MCFFNMLFALNLLCVIFFLFSTFCEMCQSMPCGNVCFSTCFSIFSHVPLGTAGVVAKCFLLLLCHTFYCWCCGILFFLFTHTVVCGLGTLAMVLKYVFAQILPVMLTIYSTSALQMDPGRMWKAPWRWFSEEMFDCCVNLDSAKSQGITLEQFWCLAKCNGTHLLTITARVLLFA